MLHDSFYHFNSQLLIFRINTKTTCEKYQLFQNNSDMFLRGARKIITNWTESCFHQALNVYSLLQ